MALSAESVRAKAIELGADLVGIAAGEVLERHPPDPREPRTPSRISEADRKSVVILGSRILSGASRLEGALNRQKLYAAELTITHLEEVALSLVYFLEDNGYPAVTLPPVHTEADELERYVEGGVYGPLSLTHAAVEAGMGTLGLNLMLLTPELGPRVLLAGVQTSADLEPGGRLKEALCSGPECGRCLLACPGDAILQWGLEKPRCAPFASPYGFDYLRRNVEAMLEDRDGKRATEHASGRVMFETWQSMLRGVGACTGCTRCLEVCPVGDDYGALASVQEEIPESSETKRARLAEMRELEAAGDRGPHYDSSARWIDGD
jgi:epoxyqueuosine reductase QueG